LIKTTIPIAILIGALFAQPRTNPLANDSNAVAAGQKLFAATCQTCHGPDGQGDRGPSLRRASFTHGEADTDIFTTIHDGVRSTQMPPFDDLRDEQIWQLVTYIQSLRRPATPARPAGQRPQVVAARTRDGREIRGVRRNEDTFTIQIVDAAGQLHSVDKLALAEYRVDPDATPGDPKLAIDVPFDRLLKAHTEPHNWLMYWGDYQGTHYSALEQIDTSNVQNLQAAWSFAMPGEAVLEATPLVADGVMFMTQPGVVAALDARTGRQLWRYTRQQKQKNPQEINPFNRGVAILDSRLFFGTLDAALVAIDAGTGTALWETQVADTMLGYSVTSAPLVVKDKVIVGVTGGEFGARGFLDAYDAATGKRLWRWYAVPGPGQFGNDTWLGESWKRGGSPMWLTGSYDPDLNLLYWTVGNPSPQIDRSVRGDLDNLFSDSVVALDADTGQRKWHYQFTPNDGHDWDSCQDVILVDREWRGQMRKLLLHADRNGHFYVLDRTSGEFLSATPFVYTNWTKGFDAKGRPLQVPGSNSSPDGSFFVYPTLGGATNFQAPSYSPLTRWMYLAYSENGQRYISAPQTFESGKQYIGRAQPAGPAITRKPGEPEPSAGLKALDPDTGRTMWDFKIFQGSISNGVLATGGNVLFGAMRDGNLVALDARTGKHLWHFQTGANMNASPMSYAVGGRQFVAIAAGNTLYSFALPIQQTYSARQSGDVVQLEDAAHRTTVSIMPSRGNVVSEMKVNGHDVIQWPGGGIPLLAPWANRLDEQAFYANGKRYAFDMDLGNVRGAVPIHGFLQRTDKWQVVEAKSDASGAWVTSRLEFSQEPSWMRQWPFAHTIEMTHIVRDGTLEVRTKITNLGEEPMPISIGFHPYFQITDSPRDEWTITVPARTRWLLAPNKVPTGAIEPIDRLFPNSAATSLKEYNLDDVFSDLVRNAAGRATMTVRGKAQRIDVSFGPNYRAAVIYAPRDRNFICFEPMAGITNALNLAHRGVYKELQSVPPGGVWQESFWIKPSSF
jgi:PQQ-dependent dehydrogenase (methanol/ethanol family)